MSSTNPHGNLVATSSATPLGRFLSAVHAQPDAERTPASDAAPAPFLSVMVRTQGTRSSLTDTLTCLAAQTDPDFEVLLLVDTPDDAAYASALAKLEPFDPEFRDRVRVDRFTASNRVVGLNHALDVGRGTYFIVLDDDDLVFANWVEEFRSLAEQHPGCVARVRAAVQWVVRSKGVSDIEPVSGFSLPYNARFDWVDHLSLSQTPPHSVAFPADVFHSLGVRYNPDLEVYEDLDVLLKAGAWCGVADSPLVTAVYRRWEDSESSINQISQAVWQGAKLRLLADLDRTPLLLPETSATRLFHLTREVQVLRQTLHYLEVLQKSKLWKLARPARAILRRPVVRKTGRFVLRRLSSTRPTEAT